MKVAYITMAFPVASETFACDEVRLLQQRGLAISVYALRPAFSYAPRLAAERKVEHIPVSHNSFRASLSGLVIAVTRPWLLLSLLAVLGRHARWSWKHWALGLLFTPRALDIFRALQKENFDVVHLYWGHFPSLVGYLVQKYLPHTAVTMALRAYDLDQRFPVTIPVARKAAWVRTICRANIPAIQSMGVDPKNIRVIYSGVDLSKVERPNTQRIPQSLLIASRLIPEKKVEDVLQVFQRVLRRFPDATLKILGDGPEKNRLMELARTLGIEKATFFLGHISHERLFQELARTEVFLLLSQLPGERLPNAVKEAMGSGCVCIVTHTLGMEEMIDSGKTGFLVPPGDLDEAENCVVRAFSDPAFSRHLALAAQQTIRSRFNLQDGLDSLKELWEGLLSKQHTVEGREILV